MKHFVKYSQKKNKQSGVTLVELVISIVILSIAIVAVLNSFSYSIRHSADPLWRNKSLKLAQLYLDEILAKNYDQSTPVGGMPVIVEPSCVSLGPDIASGVNETRETYNDVDDYHGITNVVPSSLTGNLDSSYADYRITINVKCDGSSVGATGTTPNNHAKKITVIVTPPNEDPVSFAVYKGNF
jgi:MSHA pilin protein MshD